MNKRNTHYNNVFNQKERCLYSGLNEVTGGLNEGSYFMSVEEKGEYG
jgi:hypothetical protein